MRRIGIMGGTFDPVHNGHLHLASEAQKQLNLDEVRMIPVNIPPHRERPFTSNDDRLEMLKLALDAYEKFVIDDIELNKEQTSYTIETLKILRKKYKADALFLIIGMDAYLKLDTWKDWQQLIDYANIIIASRITDGSTVISSELKAWEKTYLANDIKELNDKISGVAYKLQMPLLDISSSKLRFNMIHEEKTAGFIPDSVSNYINTHKLYQVH